VRDVAKVCEPLCVIVSDSALSNWQASQKNVDFDTIVISDKLFTTISDTHTPQGVIGIFPIPELTPVRPAPMLTVVVDAIQDPGNLGTIIRSAAANGASQVLYTAGTVDPYNPKVVRAAAGSILLIPVRCTDDLIADLEGAAVYIADGASGVPVDQANWTAPSAVVIGSESHGHGGATLQLSATRVTIPMTNQVESLNAGVAASIILYEAFRQRRRRD